MKVVIIIIMWREKLNDHRGAYSSKYSNRPDITPVHKDTQKWTLIDIAVPADQNIIRTEEEKVAVPGSSI